jgi:alpha-1,2-mannosyltransferase
VWAIAVFLAALAIYTPTAPTSGPINQDVYSAAIGGWRLASTGSPWLDDLDLEALPKSDKFPPWMGTGAHGHTVITRSPGVIAAAVPAYVLARTGSAPDDLTFAPEALTAALLAALAVMLIYLAVTKEAGSRAGLAGTAVFALASPMWSVDANALWTHTVTVLGISGMAWAASRDRWWLVGLFGSIALWGRLHAVLIVAILGLGASVTRRKPGPAIQAGIASAIGLGLGSTWSHWLYGSWNPSGGYGGGPAATAASGGVGNGVWANISNQLGLWVSPGVGFLIWTPVAVLLFPALVRSWRHIPDWSRWLLVAGVVYTIAQGQINWFTGGDGYYGYRLALELLACATPAYIFCARHVGAAARSLLGPVVGLQFAAISIGAMANGFFVPRTHAWHDNSFALVLRTHPEVWTWLVLCVVIGALLTQMWRERGWGSVSNARPHHPTPAKG